MFSLQFVRNALLALSALVLLSACDGSDPCGGDWSNRTTVLDITGITVSNVQAFINTEHGYYYQVQPISGEAYSDHFRLGIEPITEEVVAERRNKPAQRFSLISSAYACSPIPQELHYLEKVVGLKVTANVDFNENYLANERLNDNIVVYAKTSALSYGNYQPYVDEAGNEAIIALNDFMALPLAEQANGFALGFATPPYIGQAMSFFVEYTLNSGETYTETSEPMTFLQ